MWKKSYVFLSRSTSEKFSVVNMYKACHERGAECKWMARKKIYAERNDSHDKLREKKKRVVCLQFGVTFVVSFICMIVLISEIAT